MEHTKQSFERFVSQFIETNATLDYFVDFDKISRNVESIAIKLNQLNYLIGKEDMKGAVNAIWHENPKAFDVLDILIAVRKKEKKKVINDLGRVCLLDDYFTSPDMVLEYIEKTGLKDVLQSKQITNLVDYVFGVEVGLDTNARKNRGGDLMANKIDYIFTKNDVPFKREVYSTEFPELQVLGSDRKRFDFVVKTKVRTYLIEVNFYSGGGSKLNEVARAYSDISPKINKTQKYRFVWITDGKGWLSAKNKLEEAYYIIPDMYNLTTIKDFIELVKSENFD